MNNLLVTLGNTRILNFIGLVALLLAIPLTVSVSMQEQTLEQQAAENTQVANGFTISGKVFVDTNKNSSQETNEGGYANMPVQITYNNTSRQPLVALTDTNGFYKFLGVEGSEVTVSITIPSGYIVTNQSSITLPVRENTDIDFGIAQ